MRRKVDRCRDDPRPDDGTDVGADLPPIRLEIPRDRYIVDVRQPDEERYCETLVETVGRIDSVDEVRRSTRIRDEVRRIDLATVDFAFGFDQIAQDQVENLQALAEAVKRAIDENPAEDIVTQGYGEEDHEVDMQGPSAENRRVTLRRITALVKPVETAGAARP